ncbi:STAS domain-containing protein [Actinacidiphila sp. ITFR-21]|uniref:STAS domain-containing protein n=1 Tax=Actinacidiphila sp. ITFR-21 TaxID=3075199 RepID=UPI00288B156E|nr:STAS domain-containing protein [Streptomyces sp. ITFR-21]WNI18091.1 STAS domain-containing protein [Streptomyces sp. ITFR-21]
MSTSDHAPTPLPVITAVGDLDADTLHPLTAELQKAAAMASGVILDVSGVTFGDSSFINLLLRAHQHTDLRVTDLGPPWTGSSIWPGLTPSCTSSPPSPMPRAWGSRREVRHRGPWAQAGPKP